jgi:hypothetical protein
LADGKQLDPALCYLTTGSSDFLNEAFLMADLHLNGSLDKEAMDKLSRSVLKWKLKAIDFLDRVHQWERRNFGR